MTIRKARSTYMYLPGRQWLYRATLLLMVTLSAVLMVMDKAGNPAVARFRTGVADTITPLLAVAASPMDAFYNAGTWVNDMARLREDNLALKAQNQQLLQWQATAKSMENENESLRRLLNVVASQKNGYITARVVSDLGGPYVRSALISGGSDAGMKKDQAAVGDSGLVGRVVEVGAKSARVLLLSDINSRVPVIAEHAQEKSILVGNNTDLPTLSYLSADSHIGVGERIITSGDGGVFPAGVPVGIVTSVDKGVVKVQPFVDMSHVEFLSVIDYSL